MTISTYSGCFTGEGTPLYQRTGRWQTYRSNILRSATFRERIPPPIGVVSGPLMPTRNSRNASVVSSGSQVCHCLNGFSPAYTSIQWILRLPPYAFSTAASNTRTDALQISRPVPSPSTNGRIGLSGTWSFPSLIEIFAPPSGTLTFVYAILSLLVPQ